MNVHETARFSMNPMLSHELAIVRIGRYLVDNPDCGVIYTVDTSRGLEVYVDADLPVVGIWQIRQMQTMFYLEQDSQSATLVALSFGAANYKLKLHSLHLKRNTLLCLRRYEKHCPFKD